MPDNYYQQRVEVQWQTDLDLLKRLTAIRGDLLDTQGLSFDDHRINQGIMSTILKLRNARGEREWNDIPEAVVLSEMESMVAVRKKLAESGFPHPDGLQSLADLINGMVDHTQWE